MNIVVFGASGKIGRRVVNLLLQKDYNVKAFVHNHNPLNEDKNLTVFKGNIYSVQDVDNVIKGSDLIISTLGSWNTKNKDVLTSGMEIIIPAMKKNKITRIISLTGADAKSSNDKYSFISSFSHVFFSMIAKKILIDGERHISLLEKSDLDYTVIRSPVMKNGKTKTYRLSSQYCKPWESITRTSVAEAIVDQVTDNNYLKNCPYIHKK